MPVIRGKLSVPWFVILYGQPGVGKTTLASLAEDPIFLDLEQGTDLLDVARISPQDGDIKGALNELLDEDFNTLVIDSLTALERVHTTSFCKEKGWSTVEALDYGRSKKMWRQDFTDFVANISKNFRAMGRNVILIAHSRSREVTDPVTQQSYDKLELDVDKELHQSLISQTDGVFLLKQHVFVNDGKAVGNGTRVLLTTERPQYAAKSRWPLAEEIKNPSASLWTSLKS
jgi:hypothetical protein